MSESDILRLFHKGISSNAYKFFGCHRSESNCYTFRVWAPHASKVILCLNVEKKIYEYGMSKLIDGESFEVNVIGAKAGDLYKYCIISYDGKKIYKSDPYAFKSDFPNSDYSVVYDELPNNEYYSEGDFLSKPVNVYEVNLLSWKKHEDNSYYSFRELQKELVPYVKNMGYTHVEFMPITEYPFDGSWGYQVTGYFSVVNRLGLPEDFKNLVQAFHENGIKVILDWVPAHFPIDGYALYEFDGQPLYEPIDPQKMEHKYWGTRAFDFAKPEVQSFLISGAAYFLEKFALDGLRIDAVSSILYLDYDKEEGEWTKNVYGDNRNLEAIDFIQKFNTVLKNKFKGVMMIAEESSAYKGVTEKVQKNGLGFDFKWNMGWMNDVLFYCRQDPLYRHYHHNKLTFSMVYAFSENYVLPLSHDEVVHAKGSILNKSFGEGEIKFSSERLLLAFMYAHPGKKLNFMGYEIGQFSEWNYATQLDWNVLQSENHTKILRYVKELNFLYKNTPELYEVDNGWDGFEWLVVDDEINNVFAFNRYGKSGGVITAIFNFSGIDLKNYRIGIEEGVYYRYFDSDKVAFGGKGKFRKKVYKTENIKSRGKENSITVNLPKLACIYLKKQ